MAEEKREWKYIQGNKRRSTHLVFVSVSPASYFNKVRTFRPIFLWLGEEKYSLLPRQIKIKLLPREVLGELPLPSDLSTALVVPFFLYWRLFPSRPFEYHQTQDWPLKALLRSLTLWESAFPTKNNVTELLFLDLLENSKTWGKVSQPHDN